MRQSSKPNQKMKRRLFKILAGLLLILSVATGVGWASSYRSVFRTDYQSGAGRSLIFQMYRGEIIVTACQSLTSLPVAASRPYWERRLLGFSIGSGDRPGIIKHRPPKGTNNYERIKKVTVPCWAVVAISASLAVHLFRRNGQPKRGQCATCGYDLRATPDRCPECGNIPAKVIMDS
jgi:hypothetical protein